MQKPFEDATYALQVRRAPRACWTMLQAAALQRPARGRAQVGELSEPVVTDSGVHLILRTA